MWVMNKIRSWFFPKRFITISIDDSSIPIFTITKDISPEMLAKLIVRIATVVDGEQFVKILEDNGYVDVSWRIRAASIVCVDMALSEMTAPQSSVCVQSQEQQPQPTKPSVTEPEEDKPLIEALGH